jgi:hypothetical protein
MSNSSRHPCLVDAQTGNRLTNSAQIKMYSPYARWRRERLATLEAPTSVHAGPMLLPADQPREHASPHDKHRWTDQGDRASRVNVEVRIEYLSRIGFRG